MEGYALKKWESTLNLCVHAHGHDVDPIMETSCNNNYFLDKYHLVSVDVVPTMFLLDSVSRASLSTCLLQGNTLVQPLP